MSSEASGLPAEGKEEGEKGEKGEEEKEEGGKVPSRSALKVVARTMLFLPLVYEEKEVFIGSYSVRRSCDPATHGLFSWTCCGCIKEGRITDKVIFFLRYCYVSRTQTTHLFIYLIYVASM